MNIRTYIHIFTLCVHTYNDNKAYICTYFQSVRMYNVHVCSYVHIFKLYIVKLQIYTDVHNVRGFVKFKKIQKSEVGGWVKPQHGFVFSFFWKFCVFLCCFSLLYMFKKNNMGWVGVVWSIRVFFGFFDFLKLDKTPYPCLMWVAAARHNIKQVTLTVFKLFEFLIGSFSPVCSKLLTNSTASQVQNLLAHVTCRPSAYSTG